MFAHRRSFMSSFYLRGRTGLQYYIPFITFILQFHSIFASPNDRWPLTGFPGQINGKGYECGNDFFSDIEINEALSLYHQYVNQDLYIPKANYAPQGYSNVPLYPNVPQEHNRPEEDEDFDPLHFLNPNIFDIPVNNIPQEYLNTQQHFTPIPYQGPLYGDSGSSNYILWPIQKEKMIHSSSQYSSDPYYLVIRKNVGEVIDVISRTINNNHAKCIRIDGSRTELLTSSPGFNNGYQCAHEFLSDGLIQESLGLFWKTIGNSNGNPIKYPVPYVGRLYPANSGYMIWPIFSRDRLYDYSSVEVGPYFLVIDRQGMIIETVVQGLSNNFLRCTRSRNTSITPPSNAPSHSSVPTPKLQPGYYCGMVFFGDDAVEEAAKAAKTIKNYNSIFRLPAKYNGPPFNEPLLIWPLMPDGRIYETGGTGVFHVLLTKEFQIRGVAIMAKKKIQLCEKRVRKVVKDHEKSDYLCMKNVLTNLELEKAAQRGCSLFNQRKNDFYPAIYEGPSFDKSGPYFTFPVFQGAKFLKCILLLEPEAHRLKFLSFLLTYMIAPGLDRVVINSDCEVVGAITSIQNNSGKRFVLCIKLQERSVSKTYIEPDVPIKEHRGGFYTNANIPSYDLQKHKYKW